MINRDVDYEDLFRKLFFEQSSIKNQIKQILGYMVFPYFDLTSVSPHVSEYDGQNSSKSLLTEATPMTEDDLTEMLHSCPTIPALLQLLCDNDKFLLSKENQREIRKKVSHFFTLFSNSNNDGLSIRLKGLLILHQIGQEDKCIKIPGIRLNLIRLLSRMNKH